MAALTGIIKGLIFALIGFIFGGGIGFLLINAAGRSGTNEPVIALGYLFALIGWLFGAGLWDAWGREWVGLSARKLEVHGWKRYFRFCTNHKVIGVQYLVTFVFLFLFAGFLAMLMRTELIALGQTIMGPNTYNTTMSLHGIIMIAVAVATIMGAFANFFLPILIGAEDVAFPRVNALSFWLLPPVVILLLLTPLFGGFDTGWTAYPPLSVINATGSLFFLMAFITFGISSILGGLNFITTVITQRASGMTWGRLPIFAWGIFTASMISLTATSFVAVGLIQVVLDRVVGTSFFNAAQGGNPLLYEHIFWFYSHPAVYIMILPGFGIILEIITHFSRKPLFAYKWVVGSFFFIVFLGFIVWAHHLNTSGMSDYLYIPFMVTTELISIPTGVVFLSALGTMWLGRLWLRPPMLFALGYLFNFLIGGVTGIFNADVPTDIHLHDTYFIVAHFHYTMMGGVIFALMAGIYYWFPKLTGRMYNETLAKVHFWWMFIMFNVTFIPMFWLGINGMNRRVFDYPEALGGVNLFVSIAAFLLGASFLVFLTNMVYSWLRGPVAEANPWRARTLEWQISSPPPEENFPEPPQVVGDPYGYGIPGSVHAVLNPAGSALNTGGG
ncbi:MAG: cbb3-type cytochrome c oxidase subunit I [Chloroflexi bacterium]|nr:cbb3-type cytochrome c oxidase subunit I [Chloroflexota bacterium]